MGGKGNGKGKDKGKGKGKDKGKGKNGGGKSENAQDKIIKIDRETLRANTSALKAFTGDWWTLGQDGEAPGSTGKKKSEDPDAWQKMCVEKYEEKLQQYEASMSQDSEQRWLRKVGSEGTSSDKAAALTMLIEVSPLFSTKPIKGLLAMAGKTGRSEASRAVDTLKEQFTKRLLPDRKLNYFRSMKPPPKGLDEKTLTIKCVVAYFEDFLKTAYAAFIQLLSEGSHDNITYFKLKCMQTMQELLAAKPEQEKTLLSLLVNKFGDTQAKVSSKAANCLHQLVQAHPQMKPIVVKEIEGFMQRPNISRKAVYFATLFLSELTLSRSDATLAGQLVRLYVVQLEKVLSAKPSLKRRRRSTSHKGKHEIQEEDNRLVRTLVAGIHRALPYLEDGGEAILGQDLLDSLFRVCHTVSSYSTRITILGLLHRFLQVRGGCSDRFYRLLYNQLVEVEFFAASNRLQALSLVKNVVPADASAGRGVALSRRLLQVGANGEAALAAAALLVLREQVTARRADLKPLLDKTDKALIDNNADSDDEHFKDDPDEGAEVVSAPKERYQPLGREPRFAKARATRLWELHALAGHVHPFVAQSAERLLAADVRPLAGVDPSTNADPFRELGYPELLERFAYVPKRLKEAGKEAGKRAGRVLRGKTQTSMKAVNDEKFAQKKNVAPHEEFFQKYFRDKTVQQIQRDKSAKKALKEEDVDEEGSPADDEEVDKFFDEHLQGLTPKEGGEDGEDSDPGSDDDGEDDDEMEGFDSDMMPSDEGDDLDDEEEGDGDDSEEDEDDDAGPPKKKKSRLDKMIEKHSGVTFASAEDFEGLLGD